MYLLERIDHWSERHHPKWLDILRMILGLILFIKGIYIIRNAESIIAQVPDPNMEYYAMLIVHYIAIANISGGLLIAIGLLTRFAILLQMPILVCALLLTAFPGNLSFSGIEHVTSAFVLLVLIFFMVEGSGPLSVDAYLVKHKEE
ncbi:MAG: DoxX family protein [Ignavibacteriae bacterium]|nr:MAG: DoxX family protein [Ignavibacteriota bacterium]